MARTSRGLHSLVQTHVPLLSEELIALGHVLAWIQTLPKIPMSMSRSATLATYAKVTFFCMFNVMISWDHESNRTLGTPEPYKSLACVPYVLFFSGAIWAIGQFICQYHSRKNETSPLFVSVGTSASNTVGIMQLWHPRSES